MDLGPFAAEMFYGLKCFAFGTLCSLGRFVLRTFCCYDVLLLRRFQFGMFGLKTFCSWDVIFIRTFCLGTFRRSITLYAPPASQPVVVSLIKSANVY
jgi:hypothetical protein